MTNTKFFPVKLTGLEAQDMAIALLDGKNIYTAARSIIGGYRNERLGIKLATELLRALDGMTYTDIMGMFDTVAKSEGYDIDAEHANRIRHCMCDCPG